MKNGIVVTCFIKDWLDFREEFPKSIEADTVRAKIYSGVFNLRWNELSENTKEFFTERNSIISHIVDGKLKQKGFKKYDYLIKFAPAIKGNEIVFTEKEVC